LNIRLTTCRRQLEREALELEREKVRALHQRQQDSLSCLQVLETKLSRVSFDNDGTVQGSEVPSKAPTAWLTIVDAATLDISETSESDTTMTDSDDEHVSLEQLADAAKHVEKLLRRITLLQKRCENNAHGRRRVHRMYERFRVRWEASIGGMPTVPPVSLVSGTRRQGSVPGVLGHRRHLSERGRNLIRNQRHRESHDSAGITISTPTVAGMRVGERSSLDVVPVDNAPSAVSQAKHRPSSATALAYMGTSYSMASLGVSVPIDPMAGYGQFGPMQRDEDKGNATPVSQKLECPGGSQGAAR
jgi:hypothetical protein